MCDTFAAGPEYTGSELSIFGKNSDREPDEAQLVVSIPRMTFREGETLACTYVSIPQVRKTHSVVLSKPFWIWGAEMGVNEHGVAIGNEALFTKVKPEKTRSLIGMDLLRLALERSDSAHAAADTIISLLRRYGQAGPCGYRDKRFQYMNSFLIMDRKEILVLETAGREYALKAGQPYAAISNCLTLGSAWDCSSLPARTDIGRQADPFMTFFAGSASRCRIAGNFIRERKGSFAAMHAFELLRQHFSEDPCSGFNRDICMHASDPVIRKSQTTCSMVVELDRDSDFRIFTTAGSVPCITPFKPFLPAAPFLETGRGKGGFSEDSYWWRHEAFSLNALMRYTGIKEVVAGRVRAFEEERCLPFQKYDWNASEEDLVTASHRIFRAAQQMDDDWLKEMPAPKGSFLGNLYRKRMAKKNAVQVS